MIAQYAAKFEELSRYASTLIADKGVRTRKFENRPKDRIQQLVTIFELSTYKQLVNKALVLKKGFDDAQAAKEKNLKKRD